jgi:hypothetical protein
MRLRLRASLAAVAALATAGTLLATTPAEAALQPAVNGGQFGLNFLGIGSTAWPSVPYGTLRLFDNGFMWRDLQPNAPTSTSDGWDQARLNQLDTVINAAHAKGKRVILVLGSSPDWAVQSQCMWGGQQAKGLPTPAATCPPRNPDGTINGALWVAYVTKLLQLPHAAYINTVEVWNEANFPTFFNDSPEAAADLTYVTRKAVKAVRPSVGILSPRFGARHPSALTWFDRYLRRAKARWGSPYDAVAMHLYPTGTNGPESMLGVLGSTKALMAKYGVATKRIWDTETGAGYRAGNQVMRGDQIPGRVVRTFLTELTNGVYSTSWYAWNDRNFGGDPINNGNALTAAGLGFKTVYGWMVGNRAYGPCHKMASTGAWRYGWVCDIALRDGTHGRVLWNVAPGMAILTYTAPRGVFRLYGSTGASKAIGGGYRFRLGEAPVLIRVHF